MFKVITSIAGEPVSAVLLDAKAALSLIQAAQRKGQQAEAYDTEGQFVTLNLLEQEVSASQK